MPRKHVVFLMSDTGGGHRAAAEAIRAAMERVYPGMYTFELVDVYRRYTPFPFASMPELYPRWVNRAPTSWRVGYGLSNARGGHRLATEMLHRWWGPGMRRLVAGHPADVMVSVHALFNRPVLRAFDEAGRGRPPFVTVITDLVTTHAFWYAPGVERCLVPTQAAYERGRRWGLCAAQLRITGLPVHPRFSERLPARDEARRQWGWDDALPVVLLAGGADGMGAVFRTAQAINARRLPVRLVVVAGRNRALHERLRAETWHQPTAILPFVHDMPLLMAAGDVLVTKAGPSTIAEACIAGLPLVLYGAIPGQESGNVTHVVANGAGVYAPRPELVADTLAAWLGPDGAGELAAHAARARVLARPEAVWTVAAEIHAQAQHAPLPVAPGRMPAASHPPRLQPAPEDGWVI